MPPDRLPSNRRDPSPNGAPSSRDGSIPRHPAFQTPESRARTGNSRPAPLLALLARSLVLRLCVPTALAVAGAALLREAARRPRARCRPNRPDCD